MRLRFQFKLSSDVFFKKSFEFTFPLTLKASLWFLSHAFLLTHESFSAHSFSVAGLLELPFWRTFFHRGAFGTFSGFKLTRILWLFTWFHEGFNFYRVFWLVNVKLLTLLFLLQVMQKSVFLFSWVFLFEAPLFIWWLRELLLLFKFLLQVLILFVRDNLVDTAGLFKGNSLRIQKGGGGVLALRGLLDLGLHALCLLNRLVQGTFEFVCVCRLLQVGSVIMLLLVTCHVVDSIRSVSLCFALFAVNLKYNYYSRRSINLYIILTNKLRIHLNFEKSTIGFCFCSSSSALIFYSTLWKSPCIFSPCSASVCFTPRISSSLFLMSLSLSIVHVPSAVQWNPPDIPGTDCGPLSVGSLTGVPRPPLIELSAGWS